MSTEMGKGQYHLDSVRRNAILVGNEIKTAYSAKKHGGYNIYEDDKIRVSVDTFVPNVDILIRWPAAVVQGTNQVEGPHWVRVYSDSYAGDVYTFRRGRWQHHLVELAHKAWEAREVRVNREKADKVVMEAEKFGSIDDSVVFPDVVKSGGPCCTADESCRKAREVA